MPEHIFHLRRFVYMAIVGMFLLAGGQVYSSFHRDEYEADRASYVKAHMKEFSRNRVDCACNVQWAQRDLLSMDIKCDNGNDRYSVTTPYESDGKVLPGWSQCYIGDSNTLPYLGDKRLHLSIEYDRRNSSIVFWGWIMVFSPLIMAFASSASGFYVKW